MLLSAIYWSSTQASQMETEAMDHREEKNPNVLIHTTQPQTTGKLEDTCSEPVKTARSGSHESLNDGISSTDDALLLPDHVPTISHKIDKSNVNQSPVVTKAPPASSSGGSKPTKQHSSHAKCNGHTHRPKKHTNSTSKSPQSFKCDASQIQRVAGDDCCAHCILACLFCEVLSWCSAVTQCLACGMECESLCCCGEAASGGLLCCAQDSCSGLLDCGIVEDCCQSADCLEICLECCSICFPA
ncbi:hypothetical protein DNTS_011692 [Danionella cerebrum]|uniref:MyoD family inhibitor domain-containing protein n=1 Tax=Danionella cerebrum TaxID=2873325 RepID=A0A553QU44_9TELE|nr:hypothetical protein DNTS_011692 [Danionella translucida]